MLIVLGFSVQSRAENGNKKQEIQQETNEQIINEIEYYLSGFTTFQADFSQNLTGNSQLRQGRILISRPAKARWEYMLPTPSILVVKGGRLSYHDVELDQVSFADVPETALDVLLYKEVKFGDNLQIVSVKNRKESVSIRVKQRDAENAFEALEMSFSKYPLALHRLRRIDEDNRSTTLFLSNVVYNAPLADDLFKLASQKIKRKRN